MPERPGKFPEIFCGAAMLHALDRLRKDMSPARDRIRLGIDREFNPVLQYYIRRLGLSWLSVESYPKASTMDFLYQGFSIPKRLLHRGFRRRLAGHREEIRYIGKPFGENRQEIKKE